MKIALCGVGVRLAHLVKVFLAEDSSLAFTCYCDERPMGLPYLTKHGIGIGKPYVHLPTMLDENDVDLLMIGSPNHLHLKQIREALERGVTVFTEKPVVISESETWDLLELLSRYGENNVIVGLVLRYSPLYRSLIRFRDSGELGDISSIEASEHISPSHGAFFMRDWRRYTKYTGGYMLEKCCHDLDLYQGLVGTRPRWLASFGGRKTFLPRNRYLERRQVHHRMEAGWERAAAVFDSDSDIVDYQTALIEYESGENLCFHANLNVADHFRRFCVVGTKATAEGDFERNFLHIHSALTSERIANESYEFSHRLGHYGAEELMARDVLLHMREQVTLPVSVLDALESGLTALKLDEARREKAVLDMAEVWEKFDMYGLARNVAAQKSESGRR